MTFSENQVRQFYVVTGKDTTTPTTEGHVEVKQTVDGKKAFLRYMSPGGLTRSDLITLDSVEYVNITDASKLVPQFTKITVELDSAVNGGTPISGQDYILRILFKQYHSLSEEYQYVKHGMVHAVAGMTASDFYIKLVDSLVKNFSREEDKFVEFYLEDGSNATLVDATTDLSTLTGTYTGVTIQEVEQPWILGVKAQEPVFFEVYTSTITYSGDEVNWGIVGKPEKFTPAGAVNGKKIADMEYFYHGERGDQYRNIGWPYVLPTKYLADPTKNYHVLDIHYSYVGANHAVQKSEKDITLVCEDKSTLTQIKTDLGL